VGAQQADITQSKKKAEKKTKLSPGGLYRGGLAVLPQAGGTSV